MKTHTAGPWSVVEGHYPSIKEISGPSFRIAAVMWATDLTEEDYQKRNDDMHLIAAAPELLEALVLLMGPIDGLQANLDAGNKARAAIAKATGGAA